MSQGRSRGRGRFAGQPDKPKSLHEAFARASLQERPAELARSKPFTAVPRGDGASTSRVSHKSTKKLGVTSAEGEGGGSGKRAAGRGGLHGSPASLTDILRTRPEMCITKKGFSGAPVQLISNYFKLETVTNWVLFQYHVEFNVEEDRVGPKKRWLREHAEKLGGAYIFDGNSMFMSRRLTQDNKPLTFISVREADNFPIQITIRLVQELKYGNSAYLQVFGILLRRCMAHLKLQLVNRNYFDASSAVKLPSYHMEIWPGFITSIKQNESDILMCTSLTHKIMRLDTALDLLHECSKQGDDYKEIFKHSIMGEIVLTDYNNRTYRVDDVDFTVNPNSKFKLKNDEEISYIEYYERRYKIRIKDLVQPLLVSRSNSRSIRAGMPTYCLLVPELCRMTGLTERMLDNFQLKRALSELTRIEPSERLRRLMKFNERLHATPEVVNEFKQWNISLGKELLSIPARELKPEIIIGGDGYSYSSGQDADWTKELRNRPMLVSGTIREWIVVCPSQLKGDLMPFFEALRKVSGGMSFRFTQPKIYETSSDKSAHLIEAVEEAFARSKPDLVMFICSNNRPDRYRAIKKKCCVDRGVASQVVLLRSLRSKGLSVAMKVAIQINCKVGGAPWSVDMPLSNVMVVGYDVCHDPRSKEMSFGAMVASINSSLSSWFSSVNHHANGEELSNTLALDMCKALRKYREYNRCLPAKIFVYRDGVGDGQISYVYEHEVTLLKERLTEIYGGTTWKLCYIIVSKRINTRLFKSGRNPAPGTVVDDVITRPERYDFYLVSQNVNSGTVTPTNYNVISDNVGLTPDQIQRWTFKMTHLYFNWSGTTRVPAPCQYAHKLAFLVSQALQIQPHPYLESTLYFL